MSLKTGVFDDPPPEARPRKRPAARRYRLSPGTLGSLPIYFGILASGIFWFITDGPQKYFGIHDFLLAQTAVRGTAPPGAETLLWVYVVLFLLGSSGQAVLTWQWGWFTQSLKHLAYGFVFILLWVVPVTAIDVGTSAVGFYTQFAPAHTLAAFGTVDRFWLYAGLLESLWGSVGAQLAFTLFTGYMLSKE